ncbi:HNH endonuclease [Acidaminobacter sp. JC074]|uniref:HNH endonuclease n=1 Tax=Acidaminobacter sp. JC074 TaxID=2530199 RepID=UPI001F0F9AA9|nr:HNH endonuclease [Acidaminobacter sp. JC074]
MIRLYKIKEPQILVDNKKHWTQEYLNLIKEDKEIPKVIRNRYSQPEIKEQLIIETHGKCAYCESKLRHVSSGDIEHIEPKNKDARPDLYIEWTNLTLACESCNRKGKKKYYNPDLPLINPYVEEPEDHLMIFGSMILGQPGNDRGAITEKILKLNRAELLERRQEKIRLIEVKVNNWMKTNDKYLKKILKEELIEEISPEKEYSSTIRSYLKHLEFI